MAADSARYGCPVRSRPVPRDNFYEVNSDPRKLDEAYNKMLGRGGDKMLSEEVKWLAVTHKSFDHGRRGFNDRLALLGKRIVELQTSLALLAAPKSPQPAWSDEYGRKPFQHPALDGLANLTENAKRATLDKRRLANLAQTYGLDGVVRWKPKKSDNPQGSGVDTVMANTIYAVVGAIALERGGEVAIKTVRDTILRPLGL
ncbi:hypothetical protein H2199_006308 [Coniosporium tulheliwenetii]|uniref:Uncharacterized protein n=1 Tax=Coniosporium tulheliwenetii TaxID=3383036 RepID=A0ACC2YYG2_9PEZI|nr:hypothetical protein H2199_006308 [Cladosporium sp. JES 115]